MKNIFLIIAFSVLAFSQPQKKQVLIERQSSASCPNCRTAHQNFQPFIEMNEDKAVVVAYQFHGGSYFDPMGLFSASDVAARMRNYYGNNSFPTAFVNGGDRVHLNSTLNQEFVDEDAPVRINIMSFANDNSVEINVDLINTSGLGDLQNPNTRAFVILKEKTVEFETSAGSNGEKLFHDVMRYMVESPDGMMVEWNENGEASFNLTQNIDTETVDINDLYTVVFLQNVITREVFQAQEAMVDVSANLENQLIIDKVYPNPASSSISINELKQGSKFELINSNGEIVLEGVYNGNINLTSLTTGTYIVKTNNKNFKFLISR
jgi:thiol-disulfide isomerase/thioredoxin